MNHLADHAIYVDWGGQHIKLTWMPTAALPDSKLITSAHGYCFHDGKILLVRIPGREFGMPGGHVENGETPEQAFVRETLEEGYVTGDVAYLGCLEVNHEGNPSFDQNGKYPRVGYQVFYRMDITTCLPFLGEHESECRIWVEPEQVPYVINDHELALLILKRACEFGAK